MRRSINYGIAIVLLSATTAIARADNAGGTGYCETLETEILRLQGPAEHGDMEAQFQLGKLFVDSRQECGRPGLREQGVAWITKAAEQGHADAQLDLGTRYKWGLEVSQDYAQAVAWHTRAAEQGHAEAQVNLGVLYQWGMGVPEDYLEAAVWYIMAANQGLAEAQLRLGDLYEHGLGVPQDHVTAVYWYRKSAEQGRAESQFRLGRSYSLGEGIPQDYGEAAKWFMKAAEQGNANAMIGLGVLHQWGMGVQQDIVQAHMWFNLAGSLLAPGINHDEAIKGRDLAAGIMTPQQIAEAQRLAREWLERSGQ